MTEAAMDEPPFHTGEREAQRRAGFLVSRAPIRDRLPEQHRTFFAAQPFLLIAGMAADGSLAETVLTGEPGFISSPDPQTLRIEALPDSRDPFCALMAEAAAVGMLGIDFLTRQRNRVNGRIISVSCTGFTVAVGQSFGNCAKYIQARGITAKRQATRRPATISSSLLGWTAKRGISSGLPIPSSWPRRPAPAPSPMAASTFPIAACYRRHKSAHR